MKATWVRPTVEGVIATNEPARLYSYRSLFTLLTTASTSKASFANTRREEEGNKWLPLDVERRIRSWAGEEDGGEGVGWVTTVAVGWAPLEWCVKQSVHYNIYHTALFISCMQGCFIIQYSVLACWFYSWSPQLRCFMQSRPDPIQPAKLYYSHHEYFMLGKLICSKMQCTSV